MTPTFAVSGEGLKDLDYTQSGDMLTLIPKNTWTSDSSVFISVEANKQEICRFAYNCEKEFPDITLACTLVVIDITHHHAGGVATDQIIKFTENNPNVIYIVNKGGEHYCTTL